MDVGRTFVTCPRTFRHKTDIIWTSAGCLVLCGLKPSAEYNRRAAIIESVLRAGRSTTEIIRFFGYPRLCMMLSKAKYNESEKSNEGFATPVRKTHSKERVVRTPEIIQRAQELIFEDPGQSIGLLCMERD